MAEHGDEAWSCKTVCQNIFKDVDFLPGKAKIDVYFPMP